MVSSIVDSPPARHARRALAAVGLGFTAVVGMTACTATGEESPSTVFGHVHGLGYQTGGDLFVAAHSGVWRVPADKVAEAIGSGKDAAGIAPEQVAGRAQDTMGLEMRPDGTLLASGHPDPDEQPELKPSLLGLIASSDGGETWDTVSLRGEADLHDIEAVPLPDGDLRVYGYESTRGTVISSIDSGENWTSGAVLEIRDLAAVPGEANSLYATTAEGLALSNDAGTSFVVVPDSPALVLIDTSSAMGAVGVDVDGTLWRQNGTSWTSGGQVTGSVQAMVAVDGEDLWVIVADDRGVMATSDLGRSWITLVAASAADVGGIE